MTDEQLELQRDLIGVVNDDRNGDIDAATLAIARGHLKGEYVPFGKDDVVAIPSPDGDRIVRVLVLDGRPSSFALRSITETEGPERRRLLDFSWLRWEEIAQGPITDFVDSPNDVPVFVLSDGTGTRVCWGDEWEIPLPANAQWRATMMDMGVHDPAVPFVEVLDGNTLYGHCDGAVSSHGTDASNVMPPWDAETPLVWKAVLRNGTWWLEKHGAESRYIGNPQETSVFESGGEILAADKIDPARPGRVQIRSVVEDGAAVFRSGPELRDCSIRVLGLKATKRRCVVTMTVDVSGTSHHPSARPQIMVVDRATGTWPDDDFRTQLHEERWYAPRYPKSGDIREFGTDDAHVILMRMERRDENDRVLEHGVAAYTDRGETLHRLRGVAFASLHPVNGELWGWRPCPGGIILSRYPLH